jgi:hypothetical protein
MSMLVPSRPRFLVACGEPGNPSQHYGNKTLPPLEFMLFLICYGREMLEASTVPQNGIRATRLAK